jgi:hypothetical protein
MNVRRIVGSRLCTALSTRFLAIERWAVRFVAPLALVAAASAIAYAAVPVTFVAGNPLHAADLNSDFSNLDGRTSALETTSAQVVSEILALQAQVAALQAAPAPTALPAGSIQVEAAICAPNTASGTDCTCPTGEVAISGGAFAGVGTAGTNWINESRNLGPGGGASSNVWRITCVSSSSTARTPCEDPFAVCAVVQ